MRKFESSLLYESLRDAIYKRFLLAIEVKNSRTLMALESEVMYELQTFGDDLENRYTLLKLENVISKQLSWLDKWMWDVGA